MKTIFAIRLWASITLASLLVSLSYELDSVKNLKLGIPSYITAVIAFLLGSTTAKIVVDWVLGLRWMRRKIIGSKCIEGYWLIRTANPDDKSSPFGFPGILFVEYKIKEGELKAVTTRVDSAGHLFVVNSEIAFVREEGVNVRYLNYFRITYPGPGVEYGMAFAEFSNNDHFESAPNILQGTIALEKEGKIRRQSARRITKATIKKFRRSHKKEWMKGLLQSVEVTKEEL